MDASIETRFQEALKGHQAGDLARAESNYERILADDPRHARALLFSGVLRYQRGDLTGAVDRLQRSLAEEPNDVAAWNNLALVQSARGEWTEVLTCAREVLQRDPRNAVGGTHQAAAQVGLGHAAEALVTLRHVVGLAPDHADAWLLMANTLRTMGRLQEADEAVRRIMRRYPDLAMGFYQRALVARDAGDLASARQQVEQACRLAPGRVEPRVLRAVCEGEAVAAGSPEMTATIADLERIVADHPQSSDAREALGGMLRRAGEPRLAAQILRVASESFPRSTGIRIQLAAALRDLEETEEAIQVLRAAIVETPRDVNLLNNLASLLRDERRYSDAMEILNVGITVDPEHVPLRMNRASLWERLHQDEAARADLDWVARAASRSTHQGTPLVSSELLELRGACLNPGVFANGKAIEAFRQELQQRVERLAGRVDLQSWIASGEIRYAPAPPLTLLDQPEANRSLREAFARVIARPLPSTAVDGRSTAENPAGFHAAGTRARVGFFVSPRHEGAFQRCMTGILRRLPVERFEVIVFGTQASCQRLTRGFAGSTLQLRSVPARLDLMAAAIRQAEPELLFYWETGTDAWNYYLPFLRPAPRQATSWGIPDTSGHPDVDYYFSSHLVETARDEATGNETGGDAGYSERLLLAETLLTYQQRPPQPWVPEGFRDTLGIPPDKTVYLCAQNLAKVHPDFDQLLLEIVRGDPRGLVVMFADREQTLVTRLRRRFAALSRDLADRSVFLPHQSYEDYLRTLSTADVLLDTVHCGGGLTAYDAFACGKPMVTWPGRHARGRYVNALYRKMGWMEAVADSASGYAAMALQWGREPDRRSEAAREVRERAEVLFEDPAAVGEFARLLERALSEVS